MTLITLFIIIKFKKLYSNVPRILIIDLKPNEENSNIPINDIKSRISGYNNSEYISFNKDSLISLISSANEID